MELRAAHVLDRTSDDGTVNVGAAGDVYVSVWRVQRQVGSCTATQAYVSRAAVINHKGVGDQTVVGNRATREIDGCVLAGARNIKNDGSRWADHEVRVARQADAVDVISSRSDRDRATC